MKNAIIGFAFNYSNEQIAPFLKSLNRTGFTGDLILYINNKSSIEHNDSYHYKFVLINFEKEHQTSILKHKLLKVFGGASYNFFHKPRLQKAREIVRNSQVFSEDMLSYFYVNYYLATMRFILYYNFLLSNKYQNIFFSDVSDVLFQDDIFNSVTRSKVLAFEEKKEVALEEDKWNSDWVIEACGADAFNAIRKKNIYCSGTILADYDSAIIFLKDYISLMVSRSFKRKIVGLDQGFYNYLISYQRQPYFKISENADVVFTVALNSEEDFVLREDKIYFAEKKDRMPAIVHQYTRHPSIAAFVRELYA
jgi:hypothetical protein